MLSKKKTYTQVDYSEVLPAVYKPSRYINKEINSYYNFPTEKKVNFCLAFADLYEVGFSHLGLKILYSILNQQSDAAADRVYAPWTDFADELRKKQLPLASLENRVALRDFDVIGFTLQSELTYTNILLMLDLAGIPIFAGQRGDEDPLVIGGGPCTANPEPLSKFFDAFFIGEAEEGIIEIKDIIKEAKSKKLTRQELLKKLQIIDGVYVPSLYEPSAFEPSKIKKRVKVRKYLAFSKGVTYTNQLLSWHQPAHDRYVSEIMRGCSRGCRFCLAGFFYRPVRERSVEDISRQLLQEVREHGWEEAALLSLSSADYTCIKPLLIELYPQLLANETDLSLPSLRVDSLDDNILQMMNSLKQQGITIAPEAGSRRLRDSINKDISEEQILTLARIAVENRWKIMKLYFMVGLPGETKEDISEIVELLEKIIGIKGHKVQINVTLSPFVPKPHTPFQWAEMLPRDVLLERIYYIKNHFARNKRVKIKYHDVDASFLECILCRGGREAGDLIYRAYNEGAQFDAWDETFDFSYWNKAAQDLELDLKQYCHGYDLDSPLPWDHVDTGIDRDFLATELAEAAIGNLTDDCRSGKCSVCGVCKEEIKPAYATYYRQPELIIKQSFHQNIPNIPYRLYYAKKELLKFVSHLDTLRMMHRLLRRSGLPIVYTQGYNRHPKIHFGPPLSVGIAGNNEMLDIVLKEPVPAPELLRILKTIPISDWSWKDVKQPDLDELPGLEKYHKEQIKITLPSREVSYFAEKLSLFHSRSDWMFTKERKGKIRHIDLRDVISLIELEYNCLLIIKNLSGASIYDILKEIFEVNRDDTGKYDIVREKLLTGNSIPRN